ncbi:DUF1479-domain-containing protein [Neolentinus lepideus HHB14362 ss-1]|uniref:DUF1479-domain-containing protein n=1 Tax=Neolentinus lepideus HHB14362 ss-1 TaxID=1314782 RepID=A0A165P3U6_9AGAM|nr:DUF1479-domain-containing protein [Neolentinus lepideus HHB14362 ss-1]
MAAPIPSYPPHFVDIKREIAASYPDFQGRTIAAWKRLLQELAKSTEQIGREGTNIVPQINFKDLASANQDFVDLVKRRGCVVIHNVVDRAEATAWQRDLREYVKINPVPGLILFNTVYLLSPYLAFPGFPEGDKQFFQLYWTGPQVKARAHPNVLNATTWLNNLYHVKSTEDAAGVDLSTPLAYADRFRIRHPGGIWDNHPPHVDGGSIERWQDKNFRKCYGDILSGEWENHDPYWLECRMNARTSLYGRVGASTIFRTFQGWLALSETAPTEGTLKVFPDVILSNAYTILRPFFRPKAGEVDGNPLDAENWEFDISTPEFPGIYARDSGFVGPRPNPISHPHMKLEKTMVSVPKVYPGDMVFWHCDVVHSVEQEHTGQEDSIVMYIPAVPCTPRNTAYVERQQESFLQGVPPPDYPREEGETNYRGVARVEDIVGAIGRRAMGFPVAVA